MDFGFSFLPFWTRKNTKMTTQCAELVVPTSSDLARPGYREAFLALFVLCLVFVFAGIALFFRARRRSGRLTKRSFLLLLISGTATVLSAVSVLLREYMGREHFDCRTVMILHYLVMPLAVGPLTVKINVYAFRLRKSYVKAGLSYKGVRKEQDRIENRLQAQRGWIALVWSRFASFLVMKRKGFVDTTAALKDEETVHGGTTNADFDEENHAHSFRSNTRRKTSHKSTGSFWGRNATELEAELPLGDLVRNESAVFSLVMVCMLTLPFVAVIVYRATTDAKYVLACAGCDFEPLDVYLLAALAVLLCTVFVLSTLRVWNSPDPLYVLWECKLCVFVFVLCGIPELVLYLLDPNAWEREYQITWFVFETVWCSLLFFIQSYSQVFTTLYVNSKMDIRAVSLFRLLENVELRDMFDDYLASEFSIENLRFWDRAIHWKSVYQQTPPDECQRRARELYRLFIQRDAAMALNLSGFHVRMLKEAFDTAAATILPNTVFDEALKECFKLMNDGLYRFLRTEKCKAFIQAHGVDFEGDVLRNNELGLEIRIMSVEDYLKQFDDLSRAGDGIMQSPRSSGFGSERSIIMRAATSPKTVSFAADADSNTSPTNRKYERARSLVLFMETDQDDEEEARSRPISMRVRQSFSETISPRHMRGGSFVVTSPKTSSLAE